MGDTSHTAPPLAEWRYFVRRWLWRPALHLIPFRLRRQWWLVAYFDPWWMR